MKPPHQLPNGPSWAGPWAVLNPLWALWHLQTALSRLTGAKPHFYLGILLCGGNRVGEKSRKVIFKRSHSGTKSLCMDLVSLELHLCGCVSGRAAPLTAGNTKMLQVLPILGPRGKEDFF